MIKRLRDDELFRVAFESSPSGMVVVDASGTIVLANGELERIFGYPRAALIGQSIEMLVPPDIRAAHAQQRASEPGHSISRALGSGRDLRGRRSDGTEVAVEIGLKSVDTSEGLLVLATVVDITNRVRATVALEESETRYRLLSETSFDGIAISEDGVIRETNRGFENIFGRTAEQLVGKRIIDLVSDESRDEVTRRLESEEPGNYEMIATHSDGRKIRLEATFDTYRVGGRLQRITAVRDVTEKHTLERQYRQAQKMETVGRLAGGVAHDFNNLLTVISSYTSLLLEENNLSAPVCDDLTEIGKAADSAATLTRQLLAFSRQQVLEPRPLDLNDVVRHAEKMLRRVIGEDVALVTDLGTSIGCVQADFGQMEQVIMNMTINARDAMPHGGRLTIETASADVADDTVLDHFAAKAGPYVMLSIRDSGTGMTEETKARIFEPFFTTKEAGKGTGLGLSMVYGIVQQGAGHITVDSVVGKGTAFRIYLPRVDAMPLPEPEQPESPQRHGTETVLLVEDVPAVRDIVRRVLVGNGYTVLDAVDARAALARSTSYRGPIHLLLTDVVLPGLSGRDLAEQLKPTRPELKVLFTSGYTDDAVVRGGVLGRGVAFMQKPFTPDTLARRVREVLD
jgi:PAS domain S-box-containing protein